MYVVIGETYCITSVRADLEELPVPGTVVTQGPVIVIQNRNRLSVPLGVVKGEGLV
jgi:hypothetical protein